MIRRAAALAVLLLLAPARGWAVEGVTARLTAPHGTMTVGDPVTLVLSVTHPPGAVLEVPDASSLMPAESPPPYVVEEIVPIETSPPRPGETSWSLRIRPFAPGDFTIPAIELTCRLPDSTEPLGVSTDPLALTVQSVLTGEDETPADIKTPWSLPMEWLSILALAALAILLAAAALFLYARYRRRGPREVPAVPVPAGPTVTPYERALRELEALLASDLLGTGRVKEFHVALSEILKRFLGATHRFDALDRTSEEVLADLSAARAAPEILGRVRSFLSACDLVKFARYRAGGGEINETIASARELIETGKPIPQPQREAAA